MRKTILTFVLVLGASSSGLAIQTPITQITTSVPSVGALKSEVNTRFQAAQTNTTDLYTNKADKSTAVQDWSAWADGSVFVANMLVAYQGQIYKCTQLYTKHSGETPAVMTAYWSATGGGGVSSYNDLTDKPSIPATLAALTGDSAHRVVTDTEKAAWDAKQSALTAGTDYLSPTGSAANLTNFPSTLATDAEVSTAVAGKETSLGNPTTSGWCLQSTTGGIRSWGVCGSGSLPTGTEGQLVGYGANGTPTAVDSDVLSWADISGLITGTGYVKTDGTADAGPTGGASATTDLTDWPSGLTVTELGYVNGATSNLQDQINAISAGSGGVVTIVTSDPYSDAACTGAKFNNVNDRFFPCLAGYHTGYIGLTDFSNPTPVTYTLTIDGTGWNGTDSITVSGTTYTADATKTGLSGSTTVTVTPGPGRTETCSGTGITGSASPYTADMSADRSMVCTFAAIVSSISDNFNRANQDPITDGIDTTTTPTGTWVDTPGFDTAVKLYSNHLSASTPFTTEASVYSTRKSWTNNQWASATFGLLTDEGGPAVRLPTSGTTRWGYMLSPTSATSIKVMKWAGGAGSTISGSVQTVSTMTTASVLKISVIGTSIYAYIDDVLITGYPITDTSVTSGAPGVILRSASTAIDNFSAGNN